MFLVRNQASQAFTIPGSLRLVADGSAVTTGASLSVQKDGADAAAGGTLTHLRDGCYKYTPTQAETDCKILGYTLTATGAVGLSGSIRTTAADPNDAQRLGMPSLPAAGTLAVTPTLAATQAFNNTGQTAKLPATVATGDGADAATLLTRLTSVRAGYLDNLSAGPVATHADVLAINTSSSKHLILTTVGQYERPESGSTTYTVECRTFSAADGSAVNADSTPTLTATGTTSGDRSAGLSAATNPATGLYRWTYTVSSAATLEQVRFDVSATIASATFTLSAYTQVADFVAATFTTADRTLLTNTNTRVLLALPDAAPGGAGGVALVGSAVTLAAGAVTPAAFATGTGLQPLRTGTAQAGATTNVTLDAGASATTGYYVYAYLVITSGTGAGQAPRLITAYDGTTKVATVTPGWFTNPAAGSEYAIVPTAGSAVNVAQWRGADVPNPAQTGVPVVDVEYWRSTAPLSLVGQQVQVTLPAAERSAAADAFLARGLAGGADGGHTVQDALRFLRNKWTIVGNTLTVYAEDGTTPVWTSTLTATAGSDPVTASSPA